MEKVKFNFDNEIKQLSFANICKKIFLKKKISGTFSKKIHLKFEIFIELLINCLFAGHIAPPSGTTMTSADF